MAENGSTLSSEENESSQSISNETSNRICAHMNEDHAVSVYAMAKSKVVLPGRQWKISDAFLKKVTMEGCHIQVILCHAMLCQDVKLIYPFDPPLAHPSQVRSRIIAIHQEVCTPRSVYKDPIFLVIFFCFGGLAWGTLYNGTKGMSPLFSKAVHVGFYLTVLMHSVFAAYISYLSRKTLTLSVSGTTAWFAAVFLSGFKAAVEFRELVEVDRKCKKATNDKKA